MFKLKNVKQIIKLRKYFVKNYELLHNLNDIKCPACHKMVVPRNFGFYQCKYKIKSMKCENNSYSSGEVKGEAGNEFRTFDSSSGNDSYVSLIFDIKEIFDF